MDSRIECKVIRDLLIDHNSVSYYNDKRKNHRRRIFKAYHRNPNELKRVLAKLPKYGIHGWSLWISDWDHPYTNYGLVKTEPLT